MLDTIETGKRLTVAQNAATMLELREVKILPYVPAEYGWRRHQTRLTRVSVFEADESVGAQFALRHVRPHEVYAMLVPVIVEAANEIRRADGDPEIEPGYRAEWDQKAGCACGCSPGFIIRKSGSAHGFQILATISALDVKLIDEQAEMVSERVERFEQIAAGAL